MAAQNSDTLMEDVANKAPEGTIMPPPGAREIIEKTAGYVARNGMVFESKIREKQGNENKMSFLQPEDAYHAFYRWRVEEIKSGRGNAISAGREQEVSFQGKEVKKAPEKPEDFKFSARVPNISAQDLDVVKLTALYVAKMGRSWMTQLSQREAGNFQFDFLRPQHTLYQFFSRLVDQYTDLLTGESMQKGEPQKKRMRRLESNVKNRFEVVERAKKRAEYVRYEEAQKVAKEEEEEKQKVEYAQIDWHDFVVVETVVFDERDDDAELPAPITKNDLESASLEQKAAMSIDPNRRLEEAFPTFNDHDQFYGQQQQYPTPQPSAPAFGMPPPQTAYQPTPPQAQPAYNAPGQPQQPDQPPNRLDTLQQDRERARAAQEAARTQAPMKIRNDYVPRAQQKRQAQNSSICPNCKQSIPNDEFQEHLRIEMLSPEWREQSAKAAHRSSTTNLSTQEVANNLKRLASQRTDVFDPVTGQALTEEELARRKRAEVGSYDGVSTGPSSVPGQPDQQSQSTDVQEQIRQLQNRYRG